MTYPGHCRATLPAQEARAVLPARLLPLLAVLAVTDGWHFHDRQMGGDKFKPGRLLGNKVKSAWHCVFLDHQGCKIAPVHRLGTLTLFLCPVTRFAVLSCCCWCCCRPPLQCTAWVAWLGS